MSEIERLEKIKFLAGLFFSVTDIAFVLNESAKNLISLITNADTPESKAYMSGKYESDIAIREQLVRMARLGSLPAIQEIQKLQENLKIAERKMF